MSPPPLTLQAATLAYIKADQDLEAAILRVAVPQVPDDIADWPEALDVMAEDLVVAAEAVLYARSALAALSPVST